MSYIGIRFYLALSLGLLVFFAGFPEGLAQENKEIPRFASLKSSSANMRVGPSKNHPIAWLYTRVGLPLKITAEFDVWRRVQDHNGIEGWMHVSLLSAERTALVQEDLASIHRKTIFNNGDERVIAKAEAGTLLRLKECNPDWCFVTTRGASRGIERRVRGWIKRSAIWGVLEGEVLE